MADAAAYQIATELGTKNTGQHSPHQRGHGDGQ